MVGGWRWVVVGGPPDCLEHPKGSKIPMAWQAAKQAMIGRDVLCINIRTHLDCHAVRDE